MANPSELDVAAALQRILLPAGLPDVPGWSMATLYEPAGQAVLVGGDFYDWCMLPNGHCLFMLGDVSGKGPVAGALGMSVRKALKGISWLTADIESALPVLEAALADELSTGFVTLCLLDLEPHSGHVRLVLAGHPTPWWREAGEFHEVSAPQNAILGPGITASWAAADLHLAPNDALLLFSDGLTEARTHADELFAEGTLQRFLSHLPEELSSYETVLQIDQRLRRSTSSLGDDVIIAVLTYRPTGARAAQQETDEGVRTLHLAPDSASVGLARTFVADACRKLGARLQTQSDAILIASELVTNSVLHAHTDIELRVFADARGVVVEVEDRSVPTSPLRPPPDTGEGVREHGRGLELVKSLAAEFGVRPAAGGKVVWAAVAVPRTPDVPSGRAPG